MLRGWAHTISQPKILAFEVGEFFLGQDWPVYCKIFSICIQGAPSTMHISSHTTNTPHPANHCDNQKCFQGQGGYTTSDENHCMKNFSYTLAGSHLLSWRKGLRVVVNVMSSKSLRIRRSGQKSLMLMPTSTPSLYSYRFFHSLFSNSAAKTLPIP